MRNMECGGRLVRQPGLSSERSLLFLVLFRGLYTRKPDDRVAIADRGSERRIEKCDTFVKANKYVVYLFTLSLKYSLFAVV